MFDAPFDLFAFGNIIFGGNKMLDFPCLINDGRDI
jgi:hypothetical protein